MALDEFQIPTHVKKAIKAAGYIVPSSMESYIQQWYDWYSGKDDWYKIDYTNLDGKSLNRARMSLKPAKRAASEFASLILNESTEVSADSPKANKYLNEFLDKSNFWPTGQMIVEKAFALGTAAWALWFNVLGDDVTKIKIRRYDARMVVPLSWDEEGVSECAFVTRVSLKGKPADQLQMHVVEEGTYRIKTMLFVDSRIIDPESVGAIADFDTGCAAKTFGLIKPALENTCVDLSPYGMSVFADAVDAIKAVDLAFDSMFQEVELTEVKVFMDEAMIDVRSKGGKTIPLPKQEQRKFLKVAGKDPKNFIDVFSPEIRIDPLRSALDVALAEFGELCGFGQQYFMLDKASGLKTATEVTSDNSALMRNVRKHENVIRGAIQDIVTALLTCARIHCGVDIEEDFGPITVTFDDSVITDTQTEKNLMMAEIAAGLLPKWKYAVEFYGLSEEEAKAALPAEEIVDVGF
ncbi:MAG: phage portal protein [Gordonibacter sp.]